MNDEIRNIYRGLNSALWAAFERGDVSSEELRVRRFEQLCAGFDWDVSADDFSSIYLEELMRSGDLIPGAPELLDALPSDIQRAVITNGIRETQFSRLRESGLLSRFAEIIVSEDAGGKAFGIDTCQCMIHLFSIEFKEMPMMKDRRIVSIVALVLLTAVALASCSSYGYRLVTYNETTAKLRDHEIVGTVIIDIRATGQMYNEEKGVRALLLDEARAQYGDDIDDVVNVATSQTNVPAGYGGSEAYIIIQGDAIRYRGSM